MTKEFIPLPEYLNRPLAVNDVPGKNAGDEGEERGEIWQPLRKNIPFLLKRFAQSPMDIRTIILMINESSPRGRVWPKVSWMTGIPQWMLYEMVDAQYPHLPHIRQIRYPSNYAAQNHPEPPPQENLFTPLRKKSASFSRTDLSRLNQSLREYFDPSQLADIHDIGKDEIHPSKLEKHQIKDRFNEYDTMEMLPANLISRGGRAKLTFDRVNPAVYCIIYANILLVQQNKDWFQLPHDTETEIQLLLKGRHKEYAAINLPKIPHWKEARKVADINDQMLCRLLRIAPSTLARWDHGYRAPRNIRIFFELFALFPHETITMLLKVQDEIRDSILIKLKTAFPHVTVEYSSTQYNFALDDASIPGAHVVTCTPKVSPQSKPRRYRGRIVSPARPKHDDSGAYCLAPPVVRSVNGMDLESYKAASKNLIDLAHLMSENKEISKDEWHDLEGIAKINLPHLVVKK